MNSEYAVKILLTRHKHDNDQKPYFWSLLRSDDNGGWGQIDVGWEASPQECFRAAMDSYNSIIQGS